MCLEHFLGIAMLDFSYTKKYLSAIMPPPPKTFFPSNYWLWLMMDG